MIQGSWLESSGNGEMHPETKEAAATDDRNKAAAEFSTASI
eukprot:CAMPEP_0178608108 /NCGR_PEP_ID=MMETSP0697-20121206/37961_1 /TAXON_ID=265572 /ORGANISM="Extubocellulus spinifer, Strain CCMP396" /LENGTH=40 /DNA_ID= /DNA_START= /DNA_END= /DNA_ORIENTATION=